jgi:hypothetical protein
LIAYLPRWLDIMVMHAILGAIRAGPARISPCCSWFRFLNLTFVVNTCRYGWRYDRIMPVWLVVKPLVVDVDSQSFDTSTDTVTPWSYQCLLRLPRFFDDFCFCLGVRYGDWYSWVMPVWSLIKFSNVFGRRLIPVPIRVTPPRMPAR